MPETKHRSKIQTFSHDEEHFIPLFDLLFFSKANLNLAQLSDLDCMK